MNYVVMGVSGSGKTTIGKLLATALELPFYDADTFHTASNIAKMSNGIPLNDDDRKPWLLAMQEAMKTWENNGVLACSALKEDYREILQRGNDITFIVLNGDFETIYNRMLDREHFMQPEMLQSQFNDLELPSYGIHVSIIDEADVIVGEILSRIKKSPISDIGIMGMGVMGSSLAKNALSKGYSVSVYNRAIEDEAHIIPNLLKNVKSDKLHGFTQVETFVKSLKSPRKVLMMVPAGEAVDELMDILLPHLNEGDILMDGGNSHYRDTQRRASWMSTKNMHFLGVGISGGEKGALMGPSMMVGGERIAYDKIRNILSDIAAKGIDGESCVGYFGKDGAGHFVKTLHNGIEYAEMQLLAEVYALLRPSLSQNEMLSILTSWNEGELNSFLLETCIDILQVKEGDDFLLEKVLDVANSKGTGRWSSELVLEWGQASSMLIESVLNRSLSQQKSLRTQLSRTLNEEPFEITIDTNRLKTAYTFARRINHLQGLMLLQKGSEEEGWDIHLDEVVRVWSNGCILRSELLKVLHPLLKNGNMVWENDDFVMELKSMESSVSEVLLEGAQQRTSLPCFASSLQYWFGLTTENSSANIIQAMRDAFGAHKYQRLDDPERNWFTTNWQANG